METIEVTEKKPRNNSSLGSTPSRDGKVHEYPKSERMQKTKTEGGNSMLKAASIKNIHIH